MPLFITLLLAHLIADFPLQTDFVYRLKIKNSLGIALHAAIHVVVTMLLLEGGWRNWHLLLWLGLLHFLCDWAKVRYRGTNQAGMFLVDQSAHVLMLLGLAWCFAEIHPVLPTWLLFAVCLWAFIPALTMFRWVVQMDMSQKEMDPTTYVKWMKREGGCGVQWLGLVMASCVRMACGDFLHTAWPRGVR